MATSKNNRSGRPPRTSVEEIIGAAVTIGLDSFTLSSIATYIGVAESTIYNYVSGRDAVFAMACASIFQQLDTTVEVSDWMEYVDSMAERTIELARAHPGLRQYIYYGPYEESSVRMFETLVSKTRALLPSISEEVAFLLISRPMILGLAHIDDPFVESASGWLRRSLLIGMNEQMRRGTLPPGEAPSWRGLLRRRV